MTQFRDKYLILRLEQCIYILLGITVQSVLLLPFCKKQRAKFI